MDNPGSASVGSLEYAIKKYGDQGLLTSSMQLGWAGISAELRTYNRGVSAIRSAHPEVEVAVPISHGNSLVKRFRGRVVDRSITQRGTVWLCPAGLQDYILDVSTPMSQVLHVYLPSTQFSADSLGIECGHAVHASFSYEQSFRDPLVAEMAFAIATELRAPTAGGKLIAETLAASLAARLVQRHTGIFPDRDFVRLSNQGLDRRRLARVTEYIAANLEGDLTIAELAKVASLSRFHFARAFKAAVGQSPHQYISVHRLERAKELLVRGDDSLLEIGIALNFSSQANFTRAFHAGTGMTPGQYRRSFMRSENLPGRTARRSSAVAHGSSRFGSAA